MKPRRDGDMGLIATYDRYFAEPSLRVLEIGSAVIERATELRVRYRFKTADSIHLASAIEGRADYFLTGDRDLARCTEMSVELI